MAIASDLSITFAKDQLGHTNELTTLRNYAKTNKSMIENGIDKFEAIFEKCEHKIKQKFYKIFKKSLALRGLIV